MNANEIVAEYSSYIGIAAQISNDINDLLYFHNKSDLKSKKKTLPILFLLQQNDAKRDSGALIYANAVKEIYKQKARIVMDSLPISRDKVDWLTQVMLGKL
ncbi:hypothetical protein J7E73_12050 [Paenibacillus albidus]|uniref:polyprenyl synthetase family protein n=1 Tax=Paenibacillus albidus TaxID=2041023 RepID=UPI001BE984F8|nr:polyprenyl synthetase family protein [Paenibacillus albidus]MBT2289860.1 hypothetical protein [Paenibacillus albidus]